MNYYNYTNAQEIRKATVGKDVRISPTASFANAENITLRDRARVGANASLWAGPRDGRIIVGEDVLIAPSVMVTAANYRFNDGAPINDQAMDEADIVIGADVWLGYGAVVLPGTRIGDGAVIASGAVVRGTVPRYAVMSGNPAKIIGHRTDTSAPPVAGDKPWSGPNQSVVSLIREEFPHLDDAALRSEIDAVGIDSFDLISLRTKIESTLSRTIPDAEWAGVRSLGDIACLPSLSASEVRTGMQAGSPIPTPPSHPPMSLPTSQRPAAATHAPGSLRRRYQLNMPQMALSGLGESWLFKELGDMHWNMITDFLGTASSAIVDDQGDRLYATFTRIRIEVDTALASFRENAALDLESSLQRYGAGLFFGTHDVINIDARCRAQTMSTFAKYGERGKNTSLMKGTPTLPNPDLIQSLPTVPEFGVEYRKRRSESDSRDVFSCEYEIQGPHDINGVGLLYFAAYPTIFDLCIERSENKGFLMKYSTSYKDICYFANSEPDETLVFRLHERIENQDSFTHVASLFRKSDGILMASVISHKRRVSR